MRIRAGTLLCLLLLVAPLRADEVRLEGKGKPLVGSVRRVGNQVLVNPYGSTLDAMTWGVVEVPASGVEEILPDVDAGRLLDRLEALPVEDVAGRAVLFGQARANRAREVARRIAAEILRIQPEHAPALKVAGGAAKWAAGQRGDERLDLQLRPRVAALVRLDSAVMRRDVTELLSRGLGWTADATTVERMARAWREPRGTRHDTQLAFPKTAGARCSLYVPEDLHPLEPRPLVVALHGGMKDRGEPILSTGLDAFELFANEARARRWILAAPTATVAPWNAAENVALVEALVEEVAARYPVDLERCYLVGQGSGGDGALTLEGRLTGVFAAVGAAGATKPGAARGPAGRRVGVWLYHGTTDGVVPVEIAREAAAGLLSRKADFVYSELPGMGHGLPAAAEQDLYRFLARHRRPRAKSAWPRSSLSAPPGAAELRTFGDAGSAWDPKLPEEADDLHRVLARGGPEAEAAARRLAELAVAAPEIVGARECPPQARAWAAWLCGRLRAFEALDPLADVVRAESDPFLRRQAAVALRRLGVPEAANDLMAALEEVSGVYARGATSGAPLAYDHLDQTCRLAAAIVEAAAASALGPDAGAAIESHAVLAILKDRRPVAARHELGEDPLEPRSILARAVGRAYRTLGAEPTLMDLLRVTLKREPRALQAAEAGYREGVLRDD